MKNSAWLWQLAGATFTAVLGTVLHFLFDWTGAISLAPFSAVNESTWEHMKILFFPMLIFAFFQSKFSVTKPTNFWQIKCVGILLGVFSIPLLFYTVNGVFGSSPAWVNVLIFFLSDGIAYFAEGILFQRKKGKPLSAICAKILLILLTVAFIVFTFFPPQIPLFVDPISGLYGIV